MGAGESSFHIVSGGSPDQRADAGSLTVRSGASRKIVLLDIENMLFGAHNTERFRDRSREILALAEARRPTDMVIVGCNPALAFTARSVFPRSQIVTGKGKDGADEALIDMIDLEHAASRFNELVIVSGDHVFAPVAHAARQLGLSVRVVAPRHGLSTALRVYADTTVLLSQDVLDDEAQAA